MAFISRSSDTITPSNPSSFRRISFTILRDSVRLIAQRSIADHRVLRIGMDVQHRRIVQRDSHWRELCRQGTRESFRQRWVITPPQYGHRRPLGEGRPQPSHTATFLVDPDPAGQLAAERPQVKCELGNLRRRLNIPKTPKQGDAAEIELPRERAELNGDIGSSEAPDEQLADA